MRSNNLTELVDEVYAEHEGRVPVKPRLRTSTPAPSPARVNWQAISAEVTLALSVSPIECAARAAIAREERQLTLKTVHLNRRIDTHLAKREGRLLSTVTNFLRAPINARSF